MVVTGRLTACDASLSPGSLRGFIRGHIDGKDKALAVAADGADVAIDGPWQSEKHLGGGGAERRRGFHIRSHHDQVVGIEFLGAEENLFAVVAPVQHGDGALKGLTTKNAIRRDSPLLVLRHRLRSIEWADVNLEVFGLNLVRAVGDEAAIWRQPAGFVIELVPQIVDGLPRRGIARGKGHEKDDVARVADQEFPIRGNIAQSDKSARRVAKQCFLVAGSVRWFAINGPVAVQQGGIEDVFSVRGPKRCGLKARVVGYAGSLCRFDIENPEILLAGFDLIFYDEQAMPVGGKGWIGIQGRVAHFLNDLSFPIEDADLLKLLAECWGKDQEPLSIAADVHQFIGNGNLLAEHHAGFAEREGWRGADLRGHDGAIPANIVKFLAAVHPVCRSKATVGNLPRAFVHRRIGRTDENFTSVCLV